MSKNGTVILCCIRVAITFCMFLQTAMLRKDSSQANVSGEELKNSVVPGARLNISLHDGPVQFEHTKTFISLHSDGKYCSHFS